MKTTKLIEQLGKGKDILGVIVTRVSGAGNEMPIHNVKDMLELPILGVVPEDKNVRTSVVRKDALVHTHSRSKASKAYRKIAAKLIGKDDYVEP